MVQQGDKHLHPDFKKQPKVVEVRIEFLYHLLLRAVAILVLTYLQRTATDFLFRRAESKHSQRSSNNAPIRSPQHRQSHRLLRISAVLLHSSRALPWRRAVPPNCQIDIFQRRS